MRVVVDQGSHEALGVVQPGESLRAAAERIHTGSLGALVPVDLSGEVARFQVMHDRFSLRAMTRGDLPDLAQWMAAPHVAKWWSTDGPTDVGSVHERYAERIDGLSPTKMWVAELNGRSIGFLQDYRIADYPEYALLTPDPDAIGVDYAIGRVEWAGRGVGTRLLWVWALKAHHRFPQARTLFAAPDHRNAASLRCLEKSGFHQGLWFDEPQADGSVSTVIGCSLDVAQVLA